MTLSLPGEALPSFYLKIIKIIKLVINVTYKKKNVSVIVTYVYHKFYKRIYN